jgi:hypothetical protein
MPGGRGEALARFPSLGAGGSREGGLGVPIVRVRAAQGGWCWKKGGGRWAAGLNFLSNR